MEDDKDRDGVPLLDFHRYVDDLPAVAEVLPEELLGDVVAHDVDRVALLRGLLQLLGRAVLLLAQRPHRSVVQLKTRSAERLVLGTTLKGRELGMEI